MGRRAWSCSETTQSITSVVKTLYLLQSVVWLNCVTPLTNQKACTQTPTQTQYHTEKHQSASQPDGQQNTKVAFFS